MKAPAIPENESHRLQALHDLGLLDTGVEERFDRLVRLTKSQFGVSIALITLVDQQRQWFKAKLGLLERETPREISFCGHAILDDEILCVEDALEDDRFVDNPLVTGSPHIRFYAGVPLHTQNRFRIGTLCIIDSKPRGLSQVEQKTLRDLATLVELEIWQSRKWNEKLAAQAEYLRAVVDTVQDAIVAIDDKGVIQMANPAAEQIFGYESDELLNHNVNMLMPEPYASKHNAFLRHYRETGEKRIIGAGREAEGRRKDGSIFSLEVAINELSGADLHLFVGVLRDLSPLRQHERYLNAIVDNIPSMLFVKEAETLSFTFFNKAGEDLLGMSRQDLIGKSDFDFFPKEQAEFFVSKDREVLKNREVLDIPEEKLATPKGERILHTRKVAICDEMGEPRYLLGMSQDITERKALEDELKRLAHNDVLTGLANRVSLHEYLNQEFTRVKRSGLKVACLYIDLNGFKEINDTHGHEVGDSALADVATRIKQHAREIDCAARIGGDEFLVALTDVVDLEQAKQVAERIANSIAKPMDTKWGRLALSAAIGIALYPDDADSQDELIKQADHRMYQCKSGPAEC